MNNSSQFDRFFAANVVEQRHYVKFFDETKDVYNSRYENNFDFSVRYDYGAGKGALEIPNCGGHVDSRPVSSLQLAWTEQKLSNLATKRTWATNWDLLDYSAFVSIVQSLSDENALLTEMKYSLKAAALNVVLQHVYDNNFFISRVALYDKKNTLHQVMDNLMNTEMKKLCSSHSCSTGIVAEKFLSLFQAEPVGDDADFILSVRVAND